MEFRRVYVRSNVILVVVRGVYTLGESTVPAFVALTVFTLLRRFRPAPESIELPDQQRRQNDFDEASDDHAMGDTLVHYLLVPRVVMQWLFPVILTFALSLLMRGHDLPGGGFVAGITASDAFLLLYIELGRASCRESEGQYV